MEPELGAGVKTKTCGKSDEFSATYRPANDGILIRRSQLNEFAGRSCSGAPQLEKDRRPQATEPAPIGGGAAACVAAAATEIV